MKLVKEQVQYHSYMLVKRATYKVHRELMSIGLAHEHCHLRKVNVHWMKLPTILYRDACGFMFHHEPLPSIFNYQPGHIYYPSMLFKVFGKRYKAIDVIRHEYGHAFAHYYREIIEGAPSFIRAFGGDYFDEEKLYELPATSFITEHAKSQPMEDFAETFMVYLQFKGELPVQYKNRALKRKWNFIREAVQKHRSLLPACSSRRPVDAKSIYLG